MCKFLTKDSQNNIFLVGVQDADNKRGSFKLVYPQSYIYTRSSNQGKTAVHTKKGNKYKLKMRNIPLKVLLKEFRSMSWGRANHIVSQDNTFEPKSKCLTDIF